MYGYLWNLSFNKELLNQNCMVESELQEKFLFDVSVVSCHGIFLS